MTDRIALIIVICVVLLIGLDVIAFDSANLVFLGKKGLELIEYLAFWR